MPEEVDALKIQLASATKRAEEAERAEAALKSQLRLCEEHAGTMAKDFDASIAAVQSARDQALARAAELEKQVQQLESDFSTAIYQRDQAMELAGIPMSRAIVNKFVNSDSSVAETPAKPEQ
jgi:chromosome segregation ATPase